MFICNMYKIVLFFAMDTGQPSVSEFYIYIDGGWMPNGLNCFFIHLERHGINAKVF